MTDRIAICLFVLLVLAAGMDLLLNEAQILLFLPRKFLDLVAWVQFWRR
ncbi:hypothetical protein [Pseudogemmobacter faecipullorum]|uniref:Glyceraldehyde-3-phosphate dehydrogenase n=1 Tax=Pseudogemmobacter faecipullorum TaxID=2755041 RepID=A0ABS8CIA7_9RHOB|nr:hypothetical protein [Pseudogemmobacter faecipullorum]MCB5409137.1 hypothetical protein [Pseudogemmobacter faecipullorum]